MPLGRRRVSDEIAQRYAADQELSGAYRDRLAAAGKAERELRRARSEGAESARLRELAVALDQQLTEALLAAEAAERVAMGVRTYPPAGGRDRDADIARRRAKAKPAVRPWTDEVNRLRTAREALRLENRVGPGVAA
jgi:hypothetical protein